MTNPSPSDIVKHNLALLRLHDGRIPSELGRAAEAIQPGRGAPAWRKAFDLAFASGWPPPDVAQALADVFGVALERLYTVGGVPETLAISERPSVDDVVELSVAVRGRTAFDRISLGALLGVSRKRLDAMSLLQIELALDDAFESWRDGVLDGGWVLQ